jgi:hypothetical protein
MKESDDYKRGWYDGYQAAQRHNPTITQPPITIPNTKCLLCGIEFGTGAWGYVCHHSNCPTKITALGTITTDQTK